MEALLTIMTSLAQQESESLSKIVKLGIQYRFQQWKVMVNARCFLGYDKDEDGNLVINSDQAEIVKRIFLEYLEGASCQKIAESLERDCFGKKCGFSANHTFSQIVYCAACGEQFQRIH